MRIVIGADHHGFALKELLARDLLTLGHDVLDVGTRSGAETDYPDVAVAAATLVARGQRDRAVLVCGTGLGMTIAANKIAGVRAVSVTDPYSAERARRSSDAQVLCLGAEFVGTELARMLLDIWLTAGFDGGASARKVGKINALQPEHRDAATGSPTSR